MTQGAHDAVLVMRAVTEGCGAERAPALKQGLLLPGCASAAWQPSVSWLQRAGYAAGYTSARAGHVYRPQAQAARRNLCHGKRGMRSGC